MRGEFGSSVTFNSQTGDLENSVNVQSTDLWNQITDSFEPLHFGTFGALPIKILWCLGGLTPGVLAITGYILWWKRKRPLRLVTGRGCLSASKSRASKRSGRSCALNIDLVACPSRNQSSDCLRCWACTWRKTAALNKAIVASGKANMKRLKWS